MKILVRDNDSHEWQFAESVRVKAEAELQQLLAESPSLITLDDIREGMTPLVFAVREFGLPGSGLTDLLAFTGDGDIVIVECKLAANPEIKRKVIGQILEYAAYLWQMSYEQLDARIQRLTQLSLVEAVGVGVTEDWDRDEFRNSVTESLEHGAFILIIVVDEINDELRRIIRYINECSQSIFSLHALEMQQFRSDTTHIMVPHLYGVSPKPPPRGQQWTEKRYFTVLTETAPNAADIVQVMYIWSKKHADRVYFGRGKEIGSITFHYRVNNQTVSVFTMYTDGKLLLNYGYLVNQISEKALTDFHNRIHKIAPFSDVRDDFTKMPALLISEAFADPEHRAQFQQAVIELGLQIKK